MKADSTAATLYLFPVPMGDTPPAQVLPAANIDIMKTVKYFAVENIRSARRFLRAASRDIVIDELSLTELSEHTRPEEIDSILVPLLEGHDMGVISEAGCPAVADPGSDLVAAAQRRGIRVVPLVGPSSIIMSLMASGFNGQNFTFHGYLPVDAAARSRELREMQRQSRHSHTTHIFIETPYRNNRLVELLANTLGDDMALCVASDITGPRESVLTRPAAWWRTARYDYSKIPSIFLINTLDR